jgi:hypothetical protein
LVSGRERGVRLLNTAPRVDPILRPGSMALMVLVQLPDGAGVDAAWGALTSLPDLDAAVERAGADPAAGQALREEVARDLAAGQEEASSRETPGHVIDAERARLAGEPLSAEDIATLGADGWRCEADGMWFKPWHHTDKNAGLFDPKTPGGLRALREHAARIRAKAEQARREAPRAAPADTRWAAALEREAVDL